MKNKICNSIFLCLVLLMSPGCGDNSPKKQLAFYEESDISEEYAYDFAEDAEHNTVSYNDNYSTDEVCIPFVERGGVKHINVMVNRKFTVEMIFDSGCSGTLISIAEAKYLYDKGCFTEDDILGTTKSQIADGSIVENMVINLRELVIGEKIVCSNVTATVSSNAQAPLLLGNEVLDRAPSYVVDNQKKNIIFRLQ